MMRPFISLRVVGLRKALWRVVRRGLLVRTRSQSLNLRSEPLEVIGLSLAGELLVLGAGRVSIAGLPEKGLLSGGQRGVLITVGVGPLGLVGR